LLLPNSASGCLLLRKASPSQCFLEQEIWGKGLWDACFILHGNNSFLFYHSISKSCNRKKGYAIGGGRNFGIKEELGSNPDYLKLG
jgi:hypothetical protein